MQVSYTMNYNPATAFQSPTTEDTAIVAPLAITTISQPRHTANNITIELHQLTDTGVYAAKLTTVGATGGEFVQTVGFTTVGDTERLTAHAIQCADDVLIERGINSNPTPAPAAAKPAKKSRKTTSTRVCGEQCPACHPQATIADGVYYCAAGREFNVYFGGSIAQAFPKKEVMQAHALLNNLRTEAIRRRAA